MKKIFILILLFMVACSKDNSDVINDITSDKVSDKTVLKSNGKKSIKEPIYNNKEKEGKTIEIEDKINDKKQVNNTDKKLSTAIVDNSNKEVLANTKSPTIKKKEKYPLKLKKKSRK